MPREPRIGPTVVAGQAVYGRQVIGVESVLHPENEGQKSKGGPIGGQGVHGVCVL